MHNFDLQHTLLARHAQHIVLVHFPIALVMVALLFDLISLRSTSRNWATVAYYNLTLAAVATLPVVVTGLLAWRWALEGVPLKGVLRQHLLLGATATVLIWITWILARTEPQGEPPRRLRLIFEIATVATVAITAHLGGIVSGVSA